MIARKKKKYIKKLNNKPRYLQKDNKYIYMFVYLYLYIYIYYYVRLTYWDLKCYLIDFLFNLILKNKKIYIEVNDDLSFILN